MNFTGSKILILGASGGIGSAVARQLAQQGAELILVGRQRDQLNRLAAEVLVPGCKVAVITGDVATDPLSIAKESIAVAGHIDILINSAGVQTFGFCQDEASADTATLFATNVTGPIQLINALLPHMLARNQGRIVNIGSIFGSIGFPCFASYSASKFALRGFSEALRRELTGSGIQINYVAPRFTKTRFNRAAVTHMAEALGMNQDSPEQVAEQVIKAISGNRAYSYLGWPEQLFVRINAILPHLVDGSLMKQVSLMRPFTRAMAATEATPGKS